MFKYNDDVISQKIIISILQIKFFKVLREKYKFMVMTIWDAVDHYYALNVSWPYNKGNPKDLVEFAIKVKPNDR